MLLSAVADQVQGANLRGLGTAALTTALGAGLGGAIGGGRGAEIGATSGALGGKLADLGINDEFMRQAARTLQSGNAALFLLIRKMTTDKVLAALRGAGGTVMRSSFDETKEEALRTALADLQAATAKAAG